MEKSPAPERPAVLYLDNERVVLDLSDSGSLVYPFAEWQKHDRELSDLRPSAQVIPFPEQHSR